MTTHAIIDFKSFFEMTHIHTLISQCLCYVSEIKSMGISKIFLKFFHFLASICLQQSEVLFNLRKATGKKHTHKHTKNPTVVQVSRGLRLTTISWETTSSCSGAKLWKSGEITVPGLSTAMRKITLQKASRKELPVSPLRDCKENRREMPPSLGEEGGMKLFVDLNPVQAHNNTIQSGTAFYTPRSPGLYGFTLTRQVGSTTNTPPTNSGRKPSILLSVQENPVKVVWKCRTSLCIVLITKCFLSETSVRENQNFPLAK